MKELCHTHYLNSAKFRSNPLCTSKVQKQKIPILVCFLQVAREAKQPLGQG